MFLKNKRSCCHGYYHSYRSNSVVCLLSFISIAFTWEITISLWYSLSPNSVIQYGKKDSTFVRIDHEIHLQEETTRSTSAGQQQQQQKPVFESEYHTDYSSQYSTIDIKIPSSSANSIIDHNVSTSTFHTTTILQGKGTVEPYEFGFNNHTVDKTVDDSASHIEYPPKIVITNNNNKPGLMKSQKVQKDEPIFLDNKTSFYYHGYRSKEELDDRTYRFPAMEYRVQLYMSNWYLPPCRHSKSTTRTTQTQQEQEQLLQYQFITEKEMMNTNNKTSSSSLLSLKRNDGTIINETFHLWIRDIPTIFATTTTTNHNNDNENKNHPTFDKVTEPQEYILSSSTGLGSIHYLNRTEFLSCTTESCTDMIKYWLPIVDHNNNNNTNNNKQSKVQDEQKERMSIPTLYQFGDNVWSKAHSFMDHTFMKYPAIPHIKKSRLSLKRIVPWLLQKQQQQQNSVVTTTTTTNLLNTSSLYLRMEDADPGCPTCYEDENDSNNTNSSNNIKQNGLDLLNNRMQSCYVGPLRIPETAYPLHENDKNAVFLQPIVYKLKTKRHYGSLKHIPQYDIPWNDKKNKGVFRGALTGIIDRAKYQSIMKSYYERITSNDTTDDDDDTENTIIAETKCMLLDRCRLVYRNSNSTIVDVKLTSRPVSGGTTIPRSIRGHQLFGHSMNKKELLQYKGLIMLEGNDVSTGLKWAMYSNSIVLMIPPKFTSWMMEELLIPWIHYVPLNQNLSDVEIKMKWINDHDEYAQQIAYNGKLWIQDLLFHPQAQKDDEDITNEIYQRYQTHFS